MSDKGLFKGIKGIFVETAETDLDVNYAMPSPPAVQEPVVDASIATNHTDIVVVESIYEQEQVLFTDVKHDVRVVEKMLNALPSTLDTATIKATLVSLLGVNGIEVVKLLEDKSNRVELLTKYKTKDTVESESMIDEATAKIAELETTIEDLKKLISGEQKRKITQDEVLKVEIERLEKLVAYLG